MRKFKVLDGISGVLVPGRLTLLLGPPSCGKSTLLKALAGKLDGGLKVHPGCKSTLALYSKALSTSLMHGMGLYGIYDTLLCIHHASLLGVLSSFPLAPHLATDDEPQLV